MEANMNWYRTFTNFRDALKAHFDEHMAQHPLFEVAVDREEMWSLYLDSFPPEVNPMFRKRRRFDCSECRYFIKKFGNVVAIVDGKIISIWDFDDVSVAREMSNYIHSKQIERPFMSDSEKVGIPSNPEIEEATGEVITWEHFYVKLPEQHICDKSKIGRITGEKLNARNAIIGSFSAISVEAIDTVLELIRENLLYRGSEWEKTLERFRELKVEHDALGSSEERSLYCWKLGYTLSDTPIPFIKNRSIGTLLTDITNGKDIEEAVRAYEAITDPGVYKRPKPIFTQAMKEQAKAKIVELGFEKSLARRFAMLDDITINDILFADRKTKAFLSGIDALFDDLKPASQPKKAQDFAGIPEIGVGQFVSDILPTAESIEAYVDNAHLGNFVSLIAPANQDSKSMFTWGNGFSWAYTGNATDSFKKKVQEFGGKTDGDLRFSIKWNESGRDSVDLDAHCRIRYVRGAVDEIYFGHKHGVFGGELDVDIRWPSAQIKGTDKTAVENITWSDGRRVAPGEYAFYVHQYDGDLTDGFRAEIELDGEVFSFDYDKPIKKGQTVLVAEVAVDLNGKKRIKPVLPVGSSRPKNQWGVETLQFVPVSAVMFSPNHWSTAEHPCGHKHLFFMLEGCVSDERPSGIFNEYLVHELCEGNRKVMAALSDQLRVQDSDSGQLSGLGFALDKRAELIVKIRVGETAKVMKVKF